LAIIVPYQPGALAHMADLAIRSDDTMLDIQFLFALQCMIECNLHPMLVLGMDIGNEGFQWPLECAEGVPENTAGFRGAAKAPAYHIQFPEANAGNALDLAQLRAGFPQLLSRVFPRRRSAEPVSLSCFTVVHGSPVHLPLQGYNTLLFRKPDAWIVGQRC
jgi:hypothetical protein